MSDDRQDLASPHESVLDMVIRAYDKARLDHGTSQVVSDFKIDLSVNRLKELDGEKAAAHDRLFSEG